MENPYPSPDGLARSVRIGRHAAGVLLILPIIIIIVLTPFAIDLFLSSFENADISLFYTVRGALCSLLYLIAYFLLWRIASDASTKTAALLLGASSLYLGWPVYVVIAGLVAVYAYSLLLRNRRLGASDRSWIGLLAAGCCMGIIFCFSSIWLNYLTASDSPWSHMWSHSGYYQIFHYGWIVLVAIAYWRFAHCSLFAGRRTEPEPLPAGFYSPLNRYVAAVVIASAAAVGFLTLLYANADRIVG